MGDDQSQVVTLGCPLFNSSESWAVSIGSLFFFNVVRSKEKVYEDDTAASIWGAAWSFATYLFHTPKLFAGKSVVELGAGTGVAGLAAACATAGGAKSVLLTDLPDNIHILHELLAFNRESLPSEGNCDIRVQALRWGSSSSIDDEKEEQYRPWGRGTSSTNSSKGDSNNTGTKEMGAKYDVVLAVDCIYCHSLHELLAQTAVRLCNEGGRVLIADEERWKDSSGWWDETALHYGLVLQAETELPQHARVPRKVILREYSVDLHVVAMLAAKQEEDIWGYEGEDVADDEEEEKEEDDDLFDQDPRSAGSVRAKRGTVVDCDSDADTDANTIYACSVISDSNIAEYCD